MQKAMEGRGAAALPLEEERMAVYKVRQASARPQGRESSAKEGPQSKHQESIRKANHCWEHQKDAEHNKRRGAQSRRGEAVHGVGRSHESWGVVARPPRGAGIALAPHGMGAGKRGPGGQRIRGCMRAQGGMALELGVARGRAACRSAPCRAQLFGSGQRCSEMQEACPTRAAWPRGGPSAELHMRPPPCQCLAGGAPMRARTCRARAERQGVVNNAP